ncbi:Uncharacterised protein [Nocardia africana]|uniref:Uncharacterized protein n=1 Tax=Nocardia africana TaxID=134964 RepID=A0A379X4Q5_9NOCA|nr:Uncharacterised protein [Nocardia africana]
MPTIDMERDVTHGDCDADLNGFSSLASASAVMRSHASHGPFCMPYLAAHAYVSAGVED